MEATNEYPKLGKDLDRYSWIAHRDGGSGDVGQLLIDRRDDLVIFGEVNDAEAGYSYDDFALVKLDDAYYLLNTSGCSCPSPTETWGVYFGPCSLAEMRKHLEDENKENGYGVTKRQHAEFMAMLECAERAVTP